MEAKTIELDTQIPIQVNEADTPILRAETDVIDILIPDEDEIVPE